MVSDKHAIERRPLCPGGPSVTRLACGGIPIGRAPYEVAEAVPHRVLDLGINLVDTSCNYHDSEAHIGKALEHRRDEFVLITPTACTKCCECVPRCAAGIDIPERLKRVVSTFAGKAPDILMAS
jgi:predicted aldo/keto reductase-like oxidoreductase